MGNKGIDEGIEKFSEPSSPGSGEDKKRRREDRS